MTEVRIPLTLEDLVVGNTYRGKQPLYSARQGYDDRTIIEKRPSGHIVYTSAMTRAGRPLAPTEDLFLKWASHIVGTPEEDACDACGAFVPKGERIPEMTTDDGVEVPTYKHHCATCADAVRFTGGGWRYGGTEQAVGRTKRGKKATA